MRRWILSAVVTLGACDWSGGGQEVPCAVDGGACAPGYLCVHVCDCCGIPWEDAGLQPSGHDVCVPETGQCEGRFFIDGRTCQCSSATEADCPCA